MYNKKNSVIIIYHQRPFFSFSSSRFSMLCLVPYFLHLDEVSGLYIGLPWYFISNSSTHSMTWATVTPQASAVRFWTSTSGVKSPFGLSDLKYSYSAFRKKYNRAMISRSYNKVSYHYIVSHLRFVRGTCGNAIAIKGHFSDILR